MTVNDEAGYEVYCLADRLFYDKPTRHPSEDTDFPVTGRTVPHGWAHEPSDTWMYYAPSDAVVPTQGWKIHVSSCLADAERVLETVWDFCVARGLPFKYLRSRNVAVMFNAKSAFRGSSGKLATIYPLSDERFEAVLAELDALLRGVVGPYILSDLRYGDGPLYVRYGGFTERFCVAGNGERVLAIEDADGTLVPDVRGPTFALPPWIPLPAFLEPHLAARAAVTTTDLPYTIESAMQFSNGGGVYLGRDNRSGERVVLKEGRPHAGLDVAGRDAVTRIGHEYDVLTRLAGLDVVPAVLDRFELGEHHFLVEEFVDGNPLQRLLVHRYPLTHPDPSPEELAEYVDWALGMLGKVASAVDALHGRGVVFNDLHPENILVTAEGRLALIDFEVATLVEDHARSTLAHPAFTAPADRLGVDVDRYALACMYLGMFAPQATITAPFDPGKARQIAEYAAEVFPLPPGALDEAVRTIEGDAPAKPSRMAELPLPGVSTWDDVRAALRTSILAAATPDRDDRLFPGDVAQFLPGGGIGIAHGASGVLYALAATGAGRFPEHEDWLRKHALAPADNTPAGFYNGLHGVAYVLAELGHHQDALQLVERCLAMPVDATELGLHNGLAGMGLNLLHFRDDVGIEPAMRAVDQVADRLGGVTDMPEISGGDHPRAGLMFGSSGPALLFLHAYEQTGDSNLLDRAEVALRQDLRRCMRPEDGTLQVDQGWRTLPYLDEGSVGIALVLARYLAHRADDELAEALTRLRGVTRSSYFVQSGLYTGRAGMLLCAEPSAVDMLVRGLCWHAVPYGDGLAFPGNQLLRLSMDFATGTAGVLFALGAVLHDEPVRLPFLADPKNPDAPRHSFSDDHSKEV
ncbi:class III lanthionine synthetase LanKC [Labedaea rhizosphaerae]|uniref:non-specific serine/threonine protein kinase n=1 Tax=Labedaea rhizosphaerae TaxID=598644 RepID=A0A4R6SH27_LABRH|nr:class III lanthionine synthetase LanKC [Labedaea rhizosphaerae]TDQ00228.1 protein kinase-like protein [Labedaea rhizosphaerae]